MSEQAKENCQPLDPRDLLYEMIIALVDHPDGVWIELQESLDKKINTLIVHTNAEDRGKVIGREGYTMRSLRDLLGRVAAVRRMKIMIVVSDSNEAEPSTTESEPKSEP